jgi:2-(1,2-epoxy-1,2-dihydrophenyl)acetyl-CoA isomerase
LIWRCVDEEALRDEARALAQRLAAMPSKALAETRRAFAAADRLTLSEALSSEAAVQRRLGMNHDYGEGVAAFFARRPAVFRDR